MLTLPIKQEWFDMICRGEKREEYREATEYYQTRINSAIAADPNCKARETALCGGRHSVRAGNMVH